ncbi:MAG: hypothetical protein M0004_06505 [Actinomycetota bacterium]|nr:hypothetical protein [Actinomycetota bacterium]
MTRRRTTWLHRPLGAAGFILALSVPPLIGEEGWHAKALIDTGLWWIPFAIWVPAVFILGGVLAGSERARRVDAGTAGLLAGLIAIVVLILADLVRRFWIVGEDMTFMVVALWSVAGSGAVVLSGVGGLLGHSRRHRHHPTNPRLRLVSGPGRQRVSRH